MTERRPRSNLDARHGMDLATQADHRVLAQ